MEKEYVEAITGMKEQINLLKEKEENATDISLPQIRESDISSPPSVHKEGE
eukprot:CAMPEP_0170552276 /NCGR_PEP_ID=MMETSP0211-20121228/10171_1 /TAXON_ID=311385 /ORGANISM="Pseudokeronopsis sp., Strain OXSARD2" /LENGTH=50 /DNA_ID=CAMNT_0010859875 /DNA_START=861 /DNA_END=1013 /DNA_ORIENTATION=-